MNKSLVWFRRDLRLHDHAALSNAIHNSDEVHVIFIFDPALLDQLHDKKDCRVQFIHDSLLEMQSTLIKVGSSIEIRYGQPATELLSYCKEYKISDVFFNRDYEPSTKKRDAKVTSLLQQNNINSHHFKDSVIFEAPSILKDDKTPYKVFTPYMKKWMSTLALQEGEVPTFSCPSHKYLKRKNIKSIDQYDWLDEIGFEVSPPHFKAGTKAALEQLNHFGSKIVDYDRLRDIPAADGTSNMSVYIRHGNISVRDLVRAANMGNTNGHSKWLGEIIWREFYQYILDQYPHVQNGAFRPAYDQIKWRGKKNEFEAWKRGETGFPLIDAAMRCLAATGTMPNRLRMVSASFLCKTLLIDWRKGEAWFAQKLLDFDLAANNGGWQWCASSGVDAQPYFRIFNPYNQSEKFDPQGDFIKTWCPELSNTEGKFIHAPHKMSPLEQQLYDCIIGQDYPAPIVDYSKKRVEALEMYKEAVKIY